MDQTFSVPLIAPAKIAGKTEPAGKMVSVSGAIVAQLIAAGAVAAVDATEVELMADASISPEAGADIEAALKRAEAAEARVGELEARMLEAQSHAAALTASVAEAEAQRDLLQERVLELQSAIGEAASEPAAQEQIAVTVEQAGEDTGAKSPAGKKAAAKTAKG